MAVDFNLPVLTTLKASVLTYIVDNIKAVAKMDFSGSSNIPDGSIRWSTTSSRFEKYTLSTTSWGEIYPTIPSGTIMLFGQNSAPTGWTRKADWQDNAMLCFAATGNIGSGGSVNPQSAHTHSGGNLRTPVMELDATDNVSFYSVTGYSQEVLGRWNGYTSGATAYGYASSSPSQDTFYNKSDSWSGSSGENTAPHYQEVIAATKD